jgi:hypothetical protein
VWTAVSCKKLASSVCQYRLTHSGRGAQCTRRRAALRLAVGLGGGAGAVGLGWTPRRPCAALRSSATPMSWCSNARLHLA